MTDRDREIENRLTKLEVAVETIKQAIDSKRLGLTNVVSGVATGVILWLLSKI